ncbi:MAG: GntR family transcriptional regulator [Egibacteraceae bacterium]
MLLDPDDTRPPYAQVVDTLRREIEQGVLPPGAKLPTHQELRSQYGVSVGTIKRALGELQGAGLVISRQGQGTFVRTRRSVLEAIPHSFSAETLGGLWVTSYQFHWKGATRHHADITRITPQSGRRLTAKNYPPDPRTEGQVPAFHNEIEAQLVNRHVMGHWRNLSDTRYFGSVHLALLVGEAAMDGYYTSFLSDIEVDAMRWKWVRLDAATLSGVELGGLVLKEPQLIYDALGESAAPVPLSVVVEDAV